MKILNSVFLILVIVVLCACSNESSNSAIENADEGLSEDNVFKGYVDTLDKAKGVEQMIHDAAKEHDEKMQAMEY